MFLRRLHGSLDAWLRGRLEAYGRAVMDLAFPWECLTCGAVGPGLEGPLCDSCRGVLLAAAAAAGPTTCPRCALPAGPYADLRGGCSRCRGRALGFDAAFAVGPYEADLRGLCLRLKHEDHAWLALFLAGLLAEARREALARLPRDAWIVPVPLHWTRQLRRGYNQAEALARGLAHRLDLPVRRPLRRAGHTRHLVGMSVSDREEAMRGAFLARPDPRLARRTILLIDDVLTTGATCGAAARALKKAGAGRVVVAVVARTI